MDIKIIFFLQEVKNGFKHELEENNLFLPVFAYQQRPLERDTDKGYYLIDIGWFIENKKLSYEPLGIWFFQKLKYLSLFTN